MSIDAILELVKKLFDILLVWGVLYFVLKALRKNVKIVLLFKVIIVIVIIKLISVAFDLVTISYLIEWTPLALVIIFQPEIRNTLENLGHAKLLGRHKTLSLTEREKTTSEIIKSIDSLRRQKMGALIVIERDDSLSKYINNAQRIYAEVTSPLLTAVFFVNNPLHDGAVIIQGNQIACANAIFPTSDSLSINHRLGTRHRAALGISEETDCLAIVLSEETSRISLAVKGELLYNLSLYELKIQLLEGLSPSKKSFIDEKEVNE